MSAPLLQPERPPELPDAHLVTRVLHGDEAAYATLVRRHQDLLYRHARGMGLDHDTSLDLVQDAFVRAYERLGSLRSDDAIRPWVGQLTRNCCLDLLRSSNRVVLVAEPEERVADEVIGQLDEALAVRDGLASLGPECRDILDRFFCRDESYRTIGAELEIPAGTIASRISRCLGQLRSELEGRNLASPPSSK